MNTSRCRQRRKTMIRATTDRPSTVTPQPEPATLIPLATSVSHGVRIPASWRSTHVLARSSTRSHGVCCEATNAPARTTRRKDQPRGRGDGDPGAAAAAAHRSGGADGGPCGRPGPAAGWPGRPRAATGPMSSLNARHPLPGSAHVRAASGRPPSRGSCPASSTRASRARSVPVSSTGGHPVERGEQVRAVAGDDIPAHQRGDVLGRLQPAVIGQYDQMPRRDARIGGEQQRDADVPRPPGPAGSAAPRRRGG